MHDSDTLTNLHLDISPADRCLIHKASGRRYRLNRDGHIVLTLSASPFKYFHTEAQIRRLRRHSLHQSSAKLYELLRKASPGNLEDNNRSLVNEITHACTTCTAISENPVSFSVRTPHDIKFYQQLLIDIMYFKNRPILHIVHRGTRFSVAKYLRKVDAKTVWYKWNVYHTVLASAFKNFVQTWSFLNVGKPESIVTDEGSVFMSEEWKGMRLVSDIMLRATGIESHNPLNSGESLHTSFRRILRRLEHDHPDLTLKSPCLFLYIA